MDRNIVGISERWYPSQADPMNRPGLRVVLVAGAIGDYAAYAGYGSPEWIAAHGDKVSFAHADAHFPGQLKREKYREE